MTNTGTEPVPMHSSLLKVENHITELIKWYRWVVLIRRKVSYIYTLGMVGISNKLKKMILVRGSPCEGAYYFGTLWMLCSQ